MAYGGPDSLEDVEPFLLDIRGGRPTSQELIEEIRDRYAQIGGKSPLLEISRAQGEALEAELRRRDPERDWTVALGMRHWHPYIGATVEDLAREDRRRLVCMCLAPHYSRMSIGAYRRKAEEAFAAEGGGFVARWVESWGDHPLFLDALADHVREGLAKFSPEERQAVKVVFTAHSLPARLIAEGDPYDAQLKATAAAVAERVGEGLDWEFSYQSAGAGSVDWLGPQIEERVVELADEGNENLLVAPVGFVADHVEILFDIDVEARQAAEAAGARLERIPSMNARPAFIAALADVVLRAVGSDEG